MNWSGKIDNATASSAPVGKEIVSMPMDYYSISSSFQHMIISRQMELQNAIINFIKNRFGIGNAIVNIVVLLLITNPWKVYSIMIDYMTSYYQYGWWANKKLLAWWNHSPQPRTVKMEINYIHENIINHLYVAMDWYLKNNNYVITDHDHILSIIKNPIESSDKDLIHTIQQTYPQKTSTEFEYNGKTVFFTKDCSDTTIYAPSGEVKKKNYQIMLWSTECTKEHLTKFCLHVANQYAKFKANTVWSQKMYTNAEGKWVEQELSMNKRKVSTVILDGNINEKILESTKHFINTEEWHLERGINYKQSYMFYGPPGTGKTSMIKALSHEIERHIHFLNLATVASDDQLNKLMSTIDFKHTIIVLEDIDAMSDITHSRRQQYNTDNDTDKDKDKTSKLTLAGLLNQLDGLRQTHGMILIMTSNHPEVLDEALIREGRVDEKIFFSNATVSQIYAMFKNFYGESLAIEIQNKLSNIKDIAPSAVESAMRKYYREPHKALEHLEGKISS